MIGPGTCIITVNHPLSPKGRRNHLGIAKPITIGNDVWIGANCTILPGVTIGEGCSFGAHAMVSKSTEPWGVYVGCPARRIKERDRGILDKCRELEASEAARKARAEARMNK